MDQETKAYLDGMMEQIKIKFEKVLDNMGEFRSDLDIIRGHIVYVMNDRLTLGQRITRLEKKLRKLRK